MSRFLTQLTCVRERACGYVDVIPTPEQHPHCPQCGGPVRLETREVEPSPLEQLAKDIRENPRGKQWPDNAGAGAPPVIGKPIPFNPRGFAPLNQCPPGTDSVPVNDGTPPL